MTAVTPMPYRGTRLNVFQRTQRLWDQHHPYNAAQAMELVGDFPAGHVAASFNTALLDLGLSDFVCDDTCYWVAPPDDVVEVSQPTDGFEAHLSREMNRPFDLGRAMPFRPFDFVDSGRRFVGLVYQHWVADSVSIRMLMRQWLERLVGRGGPNPVRLPSHGLLHEFGPTAAGWSAFGQTVSLLSYASQMKRMRRTDSKADQTNAVLLRDGPDGLIDAIKPRAKAVGATIGDVFLAAAATACDQFGPAHPNKRRPDLAMGTIVDLRARQNDRLGNVFGLYLGFTLTTVRGGDLANFDCLLSRVASVRRSNLARKASEASQVNLAIGYALGKLWGPAKLREFYRKRFPLSGGLSSVNLTPGWGGAHYPSPLAAYHRVSPTGPMLPLVLTPTTLGRTLRICCTYRPALLDTAKANALVASFVDQLIRYAG
jgi:hypothetical protein